MKKLIYITMLLLCSIVHGQMGIDGIYTAASRSQANSVGSIPAIIDHTSNDSAGAEVTSIPVDKPTGGQNGDFLVVIVVNDEVNINTDRFDASGDPSGWTFHTSGGEFASDTHWGSYYREIDGTEGAGPYTFTANSTDNMTIICMLVRGVNSSNPFGSLGSEYNSEASASHTITGITTGNDNSLAMAILVFDGSDGAPFSVSGTGWSKYTDVDNTANDGDETEILIATKDMPSAGATGDVTVTPATSDNASGIIFEIRSE